MRARDLIGSFVLALLAGLVAVPSVGARDESSHRALRAALYHLEAARDEVKDERFKKHRERVEKDITIAIREVEGALKAGKIEPKFEPVKGWDEKYKSFKHLRQAAVELAEAKKELLREKGEWARRKELIGAIDDAYAHIEEALKEIK
jgi:predicted ribosome quality control (RQC) complex YloA/Tae2 family protein